MAYTNTEKSELSKPVCTYIKNSKKITLKWAKASDAVIGFEVYFGKHTKTKNFLANVT